MMSGKRKTRKSKRKSGGTLKILGLAALTIFFEYKLRIYSLPL